MMRTAWHRCTGSEAGEAKEPTRAGAGGGASSSAPPGGVRPLAVLLTWVGAQDRHVATYTRMFNGLGWDALVAAPPALSLWAPPWAAANARALLRALAAELRARGERALVFFAFSGAIKSLYYQLLSLLAAGGADALEFAAVRRCAVGQGFDSPVDFTSEAGQKLLAPTGSGPLPALARGALAAAAGALDFVLIEAFEADRARLWSALRHPPFKGPVLLLYSYTDGLADASTVASLAAQLRLSGHPVLEQAWPDSPHVSHAMAHPQEYASCVSWLLNGAEAEWAARAARRQQGQGPDRAPGPVLVPSAAAGDCSCDATPSAVLARQPTAGFGLVRRHTSARGGGAAAGGCAQHGCERCGAGQHGCCEGPGRGGCGQAGCGGHGQQQHGPHSHHYTQQQQQQQQQPSQQQHHHPHQGAEERARLVMRQLGVSKGTIDAVVTQISKQAAASRGAGGFGSGPSHGGAGGGGASSGGPGAGAWRRAGLQAALPPDFDYEQELAWQSATSAACSAPDLGVAGPRDRRRRDGAWGAAERGRGGGGRAGGEGWGWQEEGAAPFEEAGPAPYAQEEPPLEYAPLRNVAYTLLIDHPLAAGYSAGTGVGAVAAPAAAAAVLPAVPGGVGAVPYGLVPLVPIVAPADGHLGRVGGAALLAPAYVQLRSRM